MDDLYFHPPFHDDVFQFSAVESASISSSQPATRHQGLPVNFPVYENLSASCDDLGSLNTNRPSNRKVPIPRISSPHHFTSGGRVSRACGNCREQKAKCSGHKPACHRCQDDGLQCSYSERKRERVNKYVSCHGTVAFLTLHRQIADLTSRVQIYETLLHTLYPRLDPPSAQHVDQTLHSLSSQEIPCGPQSAIKPIPLLGNLAFGEEDLNHSKIVQSIGIMGQLSGMACLYRLKCHIHQDSSKIARDHLDWPSISSVNYFLDDIEFLVSDDVDLSWWPPQPTAAQLVHLYFQTVHLAFPVLCKPVFLDQYQRFYSSPNAQPGKRWLALLNLIFALAARHSTIMNCQTPCDTNDYSTYFSRAWRLSTGSAAPMDHPDLQQVQIEGLTAMYLLSVGHVNRSWRAIGNAIRSAITMGLNLPIGTSRISQRSKETRYRLWWSLFVLETDLCVMTGRPPSTTRIDCATPLPVSFQEDNLETGSVPKRLVDPEARNTITNSILSNGRRASLGGGHGGRYAFEAVKTKRKNAIRSGRAGAK
ncbi:hypothetical protein N7510_006611 [Penicillium lagena]|uniref:uncharacterized protein n=1 Tax=Penicillium lagena TaxID=94218 RepID=UPI00254071A1|nr:uncharacterized protein N7510_006611 [Penicillium lagena]KAJ5613417.1 hypothetical protein N7510_006611 [Penicillium lagena]